MSALREASVAIARTAAFPVLSVERLFAAERVAAGLETRRIGLGRSLADIADRASDKGVAALAVADLRRLLAAVWTDRRYARFAEPVVERVLGLGRRSADRALIVAYLRDYPVDHPAFATLRDAVAVAAGRHDWRWREVGTQWTLWEAPTALGEALRLAADPAALLRDAGFVGRLADGVFVSAARAGAARSAR